MNKVLDEKLINRNHSLWDTKLESALRNYKEVYRQRTIADELNEYSSLQERLGWIVLSGVELFVCGYQSKASHVLEFATRVAQEALQRNSYELRWNFLTEQQRLEYEYRGRGRVYRDWHTAHWFLTGERSPELLNQCTQWLRAYYDIESSQRHRKVIAQHLIPQYVLAENYAGAIEIFHNHYKLPKTVTSRVLATDANRVLYAVAQAGIGNETFQPMVRGALEPWFLKSQDWWLKEFIPWWDRLTWVYLWHQHVLLDTELKGITADYRGF